MIASIVTLVLAMMFGSGPKEDDPYWDCRYDAHVNTQMTCEL